VSRIKIRTGFLGVMLLLLVSCSESWEQCNKMISIEGTAKALLPVVSESLRDDVEFNLREFTYELENSSCFERFPELRRLRS
jgi:hypothetical protein